MNRWFIFDFKGKNFAAIWIIYWLVFLGALSFLFFDLYSTLAPTGLLKQNPDITKLDNSTSLIIAKWGLRLGFLILFIVIWEIIFYYFLVKSIISKFGLEEHVCNPNYNLGKLIGIVVLGCFFTIITCGIYFPWFKKKIISYFIDNTQYKDSNFKFHGEGIILFAIYILCLFLPSIILTFLQIIFFGIKEQPSLTFEIISNLITIILYIVYLILFIFWTLNISLKNYLIQIQANHIKTILYGIGQYAIAIITLGIYFPLAELKIYKYIMSQVNITENGNLVYKMNYDLEATKDFSSFWLEILLTIVTLGFYFPWFLENVLKMVINKTYLIPNIIKDEQQPEITA